MPEHYSKATVRATLWCKKCYKPTPHRIDNGRRGACCICLLRREADARKRKQRAEQNPSLFGGSNAAS